MVDSTTEKVEARPSTENTNTQMAASDEKHQTSQQPAVDDSVQDLAEKQDDAGQQHAEPQYPGPLKLSLTLFALCVSIFLVALDQTIIAPALGAITGQFNSTKDIVRKHYWAP